MSMYTVVGYWLDGTPILVGIIAGEHSTVGAQTEYNDGPWATRIEADNPIAAGYAAVMQMADTGPDPASGINQEELLVNGLMSQLLETGAITADGKVHPVTDPVATEILKMIFDQAEHKSENEDDK